MENIKSIIPILGSRGWVKEFVVGSGGAMVSFEEMMTNKTIPICFNSISKNDIFSHAKHFGIDYYLLDSGYFGNPKAKVYFRITKNSVYNNKPLTDRPRDRLDRIQIDTTHYCRGNKILLVPPDYKQCYHFGVGSAQEWTDKTINIIKMYTDRDIIVRDRTASRTDRQTSDKFTDALQQDVHAVVTFVSNCSVESVMHDIPVISLGPSAAVHVSPWRLHLIDNVPDIDPDLKEAWLRHLSYSQFTREDMSSGLAWQILSV